MARRKITYRVSIFCDDENTGAEAASELIDTAINIGNSYEGVSVEVDYVGTEDEE